MKHFYKLLLFCLLVPNIGFGQGNLVPNFSFEDTISCPYGADDVAAVTEWYSARASPDYFNSCANSSSAMVGVPTNMGGYQNPYHGNGYVGLVTYFAVGSNSREHIGVQLQQSLQIGQEYFVSAYVSRADSANPGAEIDCATNNFGFKFSTYHYEAYSLHQSPIDNFAHVYTNDIIFDTIGWALISGSFIADSAYTHLLIGNFFDDSNINVSSCTYLGYYYVDQVCVSTNPATCDLTVGIVTPKQTVLSLFPNPANSTLSIANLTDNNYFYLFNSLNTLIKEGEVSKAQPNIDVATMPSGIYFLRLNNSQTFKFIISH